jgi:protein-S-isoprenylcysteine O-methyltransferase Ste14
MDANSIQIQALITFIMPLLIQLAKRSRSAAFAWIDQNKPKVCVLTSGVTALLTSMGIEIAYAPHSLTVRWPDAETAMRGGATLLVSVVLQFAAQHVLYGGFWKHAVPSPSNQVVAAKQF